MSKPRIAKAKFKDHQFIAELMDHDKDTDRHTVVTCSKERTHPDLEAAFAGLTDSVREILEWPSSLYRDVAGKTDRIRVTGVSWSYSETTEVEGACIVFQVDLEDSNSPFCGTTPHLPFDQYAEDGEQPVMPDGAQDALDALKAEVQRFLDGKRAQGDLFERVEERYGIPEHETREAMGTAISPVDEPMARKELKRLARKVARDSNLEVTS